MRSPDVQGGDIGVPWFVGTSWLNKPLAVFFSSFPSPDVRQSRFLENPMDSGQRDSHHTGIDHHPGQSPVANLGMSALEGQNGRLFFGKKVMTPGRRCFWTRNFSPGPRPPEIGPLGETDQRGGVSKRKASLFFQKRQGLDHVLAHFRRTMGFPKGAPGFFFNRRTSVERSETTSSSCRIHSSFLDRSFRCFRAAFRGSPENASSRLSRVALTH